MAQLTQNVCLGRSPHATVKSLRFPIGERGCISGGILFGRLRSAYRRTII
jgi:hypothetical protein